MTSLSAIPAVLTLLRGETVSTGIGVVIKERVFRVSLANIFIFLFFGMGCAFGECCFGDGEGRCCYRRM